MKTLFRSFLVVCALGASMTGGALARDLVFEAWFRSLDVNRDRRISAKEFKGSSALFRRADRDRSGDLTMREAFAQSSMWKTSKPPLRPRPAVGPRRVTGVRVVQPRSSAGPRRPGRIAPTRVGATIGRVRQAVVGRKTLVAVGGGGTILHSTDCGSTWQLRNGGTTRDLRDVASDGKTRFVAVGGAGTVVYSHDKGLTWHAVQLDSTRWLECVLYVGSSSLTHASPGRFIAMGRGPGTPNYCLHSVDGGKTWTAGAPMSSGNMRALAWDGGARVVACGGGFMLPGTAFAAPVLFSANGGRSWNHSLSGLAQSGEKWDVTFDRKRGRFIIAAGGLMVGAEIRVSADGGKIWTEPPFDLPGQEARAIHCNAMGLTVVALKGGSVACSSDGGQSWTGPKAVDAHNIATVNDLDDTGPFFIGVGSLRGYVKRADGTYRSIDDGMFWRSRDGQTWSQGGALGTRVHLTAVAVAP